MNQQEEMVEILVKNGAKMHSKIKDNMFNKSNMIEINNLIVYNQITEKNSIDFDLIKKLTQFGFNVDSMVKDKPNSILHCLFTSPKFSELNVKVVLINKKINFLSVDKKGDNILHSVCKLTPDQERISLLLKLNCPPNLRSNLFFYFLFKFYFFI